jgi:hypothetical protein
VRPTARIRKQNEMLMTLSICMTYYEQKELVCGMKIKCARKMTNQRVELDREGSKEVK